MGKFYCIYIKILEFLGYTISLTSLDRLIYSLRKPKLTIFMYHGIISETEPLNEVTVKNVHIEQFEKQLIYIKKRFTLFTLEQAVKKMKENSLPSRAAVLTFDDGYENNYMTVFPLLKKYGIKAAIFLTGATNSQVPNWNDQLELQIFTTLKKHITVKSKKYSLENERDKINAIVELKFIGNKLKFSSLQEFSKEITQQLGEVKQSVNYKILNWNQVKEMKEYGIEFGAHSVTHPGLSAQDEETLNNEIGSIKSIIEEKTGTKVTSFSYPTGLYNKDCIKIVKEHSYECAVTSNYGFNKNLNLYELERIAIGKNLSFPLFILNMIIPLRKIDNLTIKIYDKLFKQHTI